MATGGVGVFGGTFDPIHNGHLAAASEVAAELELSQIVFVPSGESWQKTGTVVANPEQRYSMVLLATAADQRFTVSRLDLDRPGPTYTIDTIADLATQSPEVPEWFFIVGADAVAGLSTWHRIEELQSRCRFVTVTRPNHEAMATDQTLRVAIPDFEISSTDVRRRVHEDRPIRYLVPESVRSYISKSGLYRPTSEGSYDL
jgi:nicotinate-nucleotide adenylyltransferase